MNQDNTILDVGTSEEARYPVYVKPLSGDATNNIIAIAESEGAKVYFNTIGNWLYIPNIKETTREYLFSHNSELNIQVQLFEPKGFKLIS